MFSIFNQLTIVERGDVRLQVYSRTKIIEGRWQ